jgi:hypothetical protein
VKAGDIFMGIAKLKLMNDVVPHALRSARRKCRDGPVAKSGAQAAQLAVVGTKFVSPLRDAVRFINGEERYRNALHPLERFFTREPFGRKIQKAKFARASFFDDLGLLTRRERTIQQRGWNSHLRELRHLILHQSN